MCISNRLSCIMGERKLSISALAKKSGVSRTTLTKLYYGKEKSVSYAVLSKICSTLGCNIVDIYCPDKE